MAETPPAAAGYDPEAVRAKYLAERDKRLVPHRADIRDLRTDEHFARYRADPFTPVVEREPVADDVDVVIVGGGIAGILAGAQPPPGRHRADPDHRPGGWHRRHLVLEPVPGRDV